MAPSTIQKFRIISLVSGGLSMGQITLWKPFQFFLLGISPSVVHLLSLEQRIYLIQSWTGFCHIITKFNETFPNSYVPGMGVQKLKLRYRVELCTENGA
jgi:hypothetical protein